MSLETEKEIVIIESQKNKDSFEKYKNKMLKIGIGIMIGFTLFYIILGSMASEIFGLCLGAAILSIGAFDGMLYLTYWSTKKVYDNVIWTVSNKGLTQVNRKTGIKTFIPTNHIRSVTHIKDIIQINAPQLMSLGFLKNASELKKVLDDLIYKTEKQKEVVVLENTDSMSEIKKYKDLLDSGIITQEEFDTKKKQILDL